MRRFHQRHKSNLGSQAKSRLLSKSAEDNQETLKQKIKEALARGDNKATLEQALKATDFVANIDRPIGTVRRGKGWAGMTYPVNYGEIPGLLNPKDGDNWDVLVPGPKRPRKKIAIEKIVGYIPFADGNHKLIGLPKGSDKIDTKQLLEYLKRRRGQDERNGSRSKIEDPVMLF